MNNRAQISIVIPIYNEQCNIREVYRRLNGVLHHSNWSYEIIFVDDGSSDASFEILRNLHNEDRRVKVIKLIKNFGQAMSLLAGFEYAEGQIIITMDGDLQNDPSDIPNFVTKIEEGFDIVSGWRWRRRDTLVRRLCSVTANWLIGKRTGIKLHDYGCALCAIKRELIEKLRDYGNDARFIKPLLVSFAESINEVKVRHYPRKYGTSKYNLFKIIKEGLDFITKFSSRSKKTIKSPYIIGEIIEK